MDRFTRNYSIVLGSIILLFIAYALYENPDVSDLNDLLEEDKAIASYLYQFRVLRVSNGIATMSSPRSAAFPVYRVLGLLNPYLANRSQDDPDLMKAQDELADVQKRAQKIVIESASVNRVVWELDKNWLSQHGVQVGL